MPELSLLDYIGRDALLKMSPNYGLFDTMAFCATYNFTYEEYVRESKNLRPGKTLPEVQKTILHETTHLYQILSTSYGMYWYSLKQLQTNLVEWIVRLLVGKYGVGIQLPLSKFCDSLRPAKKYEEIGQLLTAWILAEWVSEHLEGNFDKIATLQSIPFLQSRSVSQSFQALEFYLAQFYQSTGRPCSVIPSITDVTEEDLLYEMQQIGFKATGFPDVLGLLETWAKVSEYWGDQDRPISDFPNLFPKVIPGLLVSYYEMLPRVRDLLSIETVKEFIFSYMAICEIALSPPILPFHQNIRSTPFILRDMNPVDRIFRILSVLQGITPIRNLESDYVPFIESICHRLNWLTPMAIAKETVGSFHFPQGDRLSEMYYQAQLFRSQIPHIFLDLGVWFTPHREYSQEFTKWFTHPIIVFSNRILRHPDHHTVMYFTMQRVMNQYMRTLLFSQNQVVTFPYKTSDEELTVFAGLVETILENKCGIRPKVHLVNPD